MKILLLRPNELPVPIDIEGSLKSMQSIVGGYIQAVYPFEEPVALICNEEGKLLGLEPNRLLRHPETGAVYDVIAGTCFLCSAPPDSENFESLTSDQIQHYTELFSRPEMLPGGIFVLEVAR